MAETDAYLMLGLAVISGLLGVYVVSLLLRFRQTRQLISTLETLAEDDR